MEVGLEAANAGCQQRARPADDCLHRDRNSNRSGSTIRRVCDATADRVSTVWRVAACPYSGDRRSVGERASGACRAPARADHVPLRHHLNRREGERAVAQQPPCITHT
jgi:hypothetical protein